jgi:hypothetical protein
MHNKPVPIEIPAAGQWVSLGDFAPGHEAIPLQGKLGASNTGTLKEGPRVCAEGISSGGPFRELLL